MVYLFFFQMKALNDVQFQEPKRIYIMSLRMQKRKGLNFTVFYNLTLYFKKFKYFKCKMKKKHFFILDIKIKIEILEEES